MAQFNPCQACGKVVNRYLETCPYCRADPGGDRSDAPSLVPPPPAPVGIPSGTFHPLESVALFVQLLFGLHILGSVARFVTSFPYRESLLEIANGDTFVTTDVLLTEDRYLAAVGVATFGYIVLSIVFIVWFWRAYANLPAIGRPRSRATSWAIWSWFVPFAGLVIPYGLGAEIWTQSRPELGEVREHRDPNMEPVISWWALFVIMSLVNQVGYLFGGEDPDPAEVAAFVGIDTVASVVAIAGAVAGIRFVRLTTARQQELHRLVGSNPRRDVLDVLVD